MKRFSLVAVSLAFAMVLAASASAQATKIGWIDTSAFGEEKTGVTKYINAMKALEGEMKPRITKMQNMDNELKTIADRLQKAQANTAVPVDPKTLQADQDKGQDLQRQLEFEKKQYDAELEKASSRVLGPVSADISKSIQEYAKSKGFAVILDISALAQASAILAMDGTADVTKDFIAYYNQTHPATTATTTTPK